MDCSCKQKTELHDRRNEEICNELKSASEETRFHIQEAITDEEAETCILGATALDVDVAFSLSRMQWSSTYAQVLSALLGAGHEHGLVQEVLSPEGRT